MSVSVTTTPQYPAVGTATRVDFTLTGAGNYLKGYFTDAPIGSEAKTKLLNSGAARTEAFVTDSNKPWLFTPDAGGIYTIQVDQYTKGATGYGGGYQDSPAGFAQELLVSSSTITIPAGQRVTQKIGFGPDTATLTLFVIGNTVRATRFDQEGFTSPLISDARTPKAATAALNAGVVAAVSAFANVPASTLIGDIPAVIDDFFFKYGGHRFSGVYHSHNDTDNVPDTAADVAPNPPSVEGEKSSATRMVKLLGQHMRNDNGGTATSVGGTSSANYHSTVDWPNALLVTGIGDQLDAIAAIADVWRAYEAHRLNTVSHAVADTFWVLNALPPLLNVHALFLTELAKQSPTAPASVNAGVTALIHGAGFEES